MRKVPYRRCALAPPLSVREPPTPSAPINKPKESKSSSESKTPSLEPKESNTSSIKPKESKASEQNHDEIIAGLSAEDFAIVWKLLALDSVVNQYAEYEVKNVLNLCTSGPELEYNGVKIDSSKSKQMTERLAFHGTDMKNIASICVQGFTPSTTGSHGAGVYVTESALTASSFTRDTVNLSATKTLIVVRILVSSGEQFQYHGSLPTYCIRDPKRVLPVAILTLNHKPTSQPIQ